MNESQSKQPQDFSKEAPLRPHEFDGIQEFDKSMPNWWLFTFYASIVFAFAYWAVLHRYGEDTAPGVALSRDMEHSAQEAARKAGVLNDDILWTMSRNPAVVSSGTQVYRDSCAACHLPDLGGAIGPNLKDQVWIHGGRPMDILKIVTEGVGAKGMPTWGPVLGRQKIAEVVAFVLSHHTPPAGGTR
jgi:cytochrome c oxidase cbb3-type subunit 3